ncbi:fimbrial protein, partial [Escherichia coli]
MINKLIFLLTLVSFANCSFAEQIKQEATLSLNVNILKPVCKLANGDQTLYFDDFDALDVVTNSNKLIKNTVLNFTECSSVKKLNISFVQSG